MGKRITFLLFGLFASLSLLKAQSTDLDSLNSIIESDQPDTLRINAANAKALLLEMSDYEGAKKSALWALERSKAIGFEKGIYESYYSLSSMHYESGMSQVMLQYIDSMMAMNDPSITEEHRGDAYNLLGIAYYTEGDLVQAIEAWKTARLLLPPKRQSAVISNIGNIYLSSEEMDKAIGWFLEAAELNERDSVYHFLAMNYHNIANCYPIHDTLHLYYLKKSQLNTHRSGYIRMLPPNYMDIVRYYADNRQLREAATYLDSLIHFPVAEDSAYVVFNRELSRVYYREALGMEKLAGNPIPADLPEADRSAKDLLFDAAQTLAEMTDYTRDPRSLYWDNQRLGVIYQALGDYKNSAERYELSLRYKDSLAVSKAQFILKEYERDLEDAAERESELRLANARQKERFRFYSTLAGGGIFLVLAIGLWSRLRYTRRTNAIITKEKERSEELLLNILPEEVASELKAKGEAEAQLIDHVTVLFTDFKGFTAMAEQLSPKELVKDLNTCFSEFDRIMQKYGIEKIKTIGDSYMAAGGLPTPKDTHAQDVVNAAFEMRAFIEAGKAKKVKAGLPYFEIRIGVHSGPVVAGIVGVKKFQYDIWGDTVNTASRMESSGEVGKVNISQTTYELIKETGQFKFEMRGKIEAKGKGELDMYFVERND